MFEATLDRYPSSRGILFRGHADEWEKFEHLKVGDDFTAPGFMSTAVSPWGAYGRKVMLLILAKDAKTGLNTMENAEALLNRNLKFKVKKVYRSDIKGDPQLVLVIEQIAPGNGE